MTDRPAQAPVPPQQTVMQLLFGKQMTVCLPKGATKCQRTTESSFPTRESTLR